MGRAQRNFRAVKLLGMVLRWQIHAVLQLSKPTECPAPEERPSINYGLQVVVLDRFTDGKNVPLRWGCC